MCVHCLEEISIGMELWRRGRKELLVLLVSPGKNGVIPVRRYPSGINLQSYINLVRQSLTNTYNNLSRFKV